MAFSPQFSIETTHRPDGRIDYRFDDALKNAILDLVEFRNRAIREGDRTGLDATYDGLDSRDYSMRWNDHERTSYYDWYMNRIERGLGAEIQAIHVKAIYSYDNLPFLYNANWSVGKPEFELQIVTGENRVSWFIRCSILDENQLRVVLPCFIDPPWEEPIIETRGGMIEFNSEKFSKELADHIGLEFCSWSVFLYGLVKIRAFALLVEPSAGWIIPCLLTDRENFDEEALGKWCLGDWRLHHFTGSPASVWPYGEHLCNLIREYVEDKEHDCVHPKFDYWAQPKEDFDILVACGLALQQPGFCEFLKRLELTDDFELGVFHAHDELHECNFAKKENQDLSVLKKSS